MILKATRANVFGDVRAEHDHVMLDQSFFEWQDYRSLYENTDRFIVVGRRGTGKSALTYKLSQEWGTNKKFVILIAPTEEQVFGIRPCAAKFGATVTRIRAAIKIIYRYAILVEIGSRLATYYKSKSDVQSDELLNEHVRKWHSIGGDISDKIRQILKNICFTNVDDPLDRIANMPQILRVTDLSKSVGKILRIYNFKFLLLVDRLDEGYEPDIIGIGIVDGIIYGVDEVRSEFKDCFKSIVFFRDNIFRALQIEDSDFSRNLEAQVLRLHWDPQELFYMVAKRIRIGLDVSQESDIRAWNAITAKGLQGREGFKKCLRLTLYRPRDVIVLLNTAYYQAQRQQRDTLIEEDIDHSSKQISLTRFDDLGKEYEHVIPGIRLLTKVFFNGPVKLSFNAACQLVEKAFNDQSASVAAMQNFNILSSPLEGLKTLYGVGFLGVLNYDDDKFVFSHDGKQSERNIGEDSVLLIHPCYWDALNLQRIELDQSDAEEIFDEYEITISSKSSSQRKHLLGQMISEVEGIPVGSEGASDFEMWCKKAIEIAFAKQLANVQLKPNKQATQRRDITATNQAISGF